MVITMRAVDEANKVVSQRVDTITTPTFHAYLHRKEITQWLNDQLVAGHLLSMSAIAE